MLHCLVLIQILNSYPSLSAELQSPWRVHSVLHQVLSSSSGILIGFSNFTHSKRNSRPAPLMISPIQLMSTNVLVVPKPKPYTLNYFLSLKHSIHHQFLLSLNLKCISPPPPLSSWSKLYQLSPGLLQSSSNPSFCFSPCLLQSILNPVIKVIALK